MIISPEKDRFRNIVEIGKVAHRESSEKQMGTQRKATEQKPSFGSAVRQLFRHLGDPAALVDNPLVWHLFQPPNGDAGTEFMRSVIVNEIMTAARSCYSKGLAEGKSRLADRELAIISQLCELQSAENIAGRLKISLPQYYRDRRNACVKVAGVLAERQKRGIVATIQSNLLRFDLRRAATLIDQGFSARAISQLERLLPNAESTGDLVLILTETSRAAFDLGDVARARKACQVAKGYLSAAAAVSLNDHYDTLRYRVGIEEFQVASVTERPPDAYAILAPLAKEIGWSDYVSFEQDELAIQVLAETCHAAMLAGKIDEAQKAIQRAHEIAQREQMPEPVRSQIALMRAYSYEGGENNSSHRLSLLSQALKLAQQAGSANAMLTAMLILVDHCAGLGYEDRAKGYGEQAFALATGTEGGHIVAAAADTIVAILLRTRHWDFAEELMNTVASPSSPYYLMRAKAHQGQLAACHGDFDAAIRAFTAANELAVELQSTRTGAFVLPGLANAQFLVGSRRQARANALAAIDLLEVSGSPTALRCGYNAIGAVLAK
jgi:hypothetical protein